MKLTDVNGVKDLGDWMASKGFTPGENSFFGTVHMVHTASSLHYMTVKDGKHLRAPNGQGNLAIDCNDNNVSDDARKFGNEAQALSWLFHRLLAYFHEHHPNALNEMFFDGMGFIAEDGYGVNHAITGHDDHLHIGFNSLQW